MLKATDLTLDPKLNGGISAAGEHLREYGNSLCHLLDELDEPLGLDALCDLHGEFEKPFPKMDVIESALRDIERVLARQTTSSLDRLGRERNFYASDATRWHGARVSELLVRFSTED
ncbi:hypothetical protein [Primorskyibacter flagellatus]|uniref:Uncharacterized protein n=1 Tax=Primorskyibacter flagellatus TaxID=1387277 RepID=A0A1W2DRX9_9RHOB|nr:hypothetical protein [Primorskyibacter flagellatus]SMC99802.1 hypothetical protein SAMN06295998_1176 [Primorskyibacter flagellatus]